MQIPVRGDSFAEATLARIQTIALCLIAATLLADLVIDHVRPAIVLMLKEHHYFDAARMCHEVQSNRQQLRDGSARFGRETLRAIDQSATVALMDCYEQEYLRRLLRSWGVSEHDLNRIDLVARNEAATSVRYIVDGVTGDK